MPTQLYEAQSIKFTVEVNMIIIIIILDWGPVLHFCPLEALQPVWLTAEVYCTIPIFLIVPTLAARCLLCPQPAVVPKQPEEELWVEIAAR
jgi:hypothetical protein